ncbi:MAG: hypothetical protein COV67_04700 [Nitrospinae bacterium CG11_big_fil_rev_8_21_14_0_20_56_8]|nr:MAG: hypothetical protein COV67_04700 [Nitrospinae bacterium CG11_big_fil_rev_8_21_14_0_20_56_8]
MSEITAKKTALAFALFSFGLMVVGSVINGSTFLTALIRGGEAAILFGLLGLIFLALLVDRGESMDSIPASPMSETVEEASKETEPDQ